LNKGSKVGAIILAAGVSHRMGWDKLFSPILNRPLIWWTLETFHNSTLIDNIILVLHEGNWERGREIIENYSFTKVKQICLGGQRRQDSVKEGLKRLPPCSWVVIHDGARPCVTPELIQRGLKMAKRYGAAIAAVPVKDTVKIVGEGNVIESTPERGKLWLAQTPQIFSFDLIKKAYEREEEATDDASLVERMGYRVAVYLGSYENIKVTTPEDLTIAESFLKRRANASGVGLRRP